MIMSLPKDSLVSGFRSGQQEIYSFQRLVEGGVCERYSSLGLRNRGMQSDLHPTCLYNNSPFVNYGCIVARSNY